MIEKCHGRSNEILVLKEREVLLMSNEKNAINEAVQPKLKLGFKLKWSSFNIASTAAYTFLGYITLYATNVMSLNVATVGIVLMVSKLFDGISDIIMGWIIDHTHSRFGKARPYMLAIVPFWICTAIFFSAPPMGKTAGIIFLFVMYTMIYSVFCTMFGCAEAPLMANALEDSRQSVSLISFNGVFATVVGLVTGISYPQIISAIGFEAAGWRTLAWSLAIPMSLIGTIRFFTIKEIRNTVSSNEEKAYAKTSTRDLLLALKQNKYIAIVGALAFLAYFGSQLATYCANYFALYIMGDIGISSILSLALLSLVVMMILYPMLVRRFTLKKVVNVSMVLGIIGSLIRLIDLQSIPVAFLSSCLVYISFNAFYGFIASLVIDCMDYGEWKTGIRVEGLLGSVQSVMNKLGPALATGLGGILLGIAKFDGALDVQPDSAVAMIVAMCTYIPVIVYVIFLIVFHFYDLEAKMPEIRKDLEKRRKS